MKKQSSRKALVIGCSEYRKAEHSIPSMAEGAVAIAEQLRTNYDGSPNFDVQLVTDKETGVPPYHSREELEKTIEQFLAAGKEEDTGVFYFLGHGNGEKLFDSAAMWFAGPEQSVYDLDIKMAWLMDKIQRSRYGNLYVFIDCCFSGCFGRDFKQRLRDGICILTSCSDAQKAKGKYGDKLTKYSLFTTFVKEALEGMAADPITGVITFSSIYNYVCQHLGMRQSPVLRCTTADYMPLKQHKVDYNQELLDIIHTCFLLNDRDQWPEGAGWLRAYTRLSNLTPHDQERFDRELPFMLKKGYVKEMVGTNKDGVKQPFFMLTSKGHRLWDMVEHEYAFEF